MTSSRPPTVLVLSRDLAVRAVACTLIERAGVSVEPAATVDEAARLAGRAAPPPIVLVDAATPAADLDQLRARLDAPTIATLPADLGADLVATVYELVGDGFDTAGDTGAHDIPTLESAVLWETVPIDDARHGDFISWTPVLGAAACTAFVVRIRPLQLGSMAGWIVETADLVTWMPCGARVQRARVQVP